MPTTELAHLRRAIDCARKIMTKPVIENAEREPEPNTTRELPQANPNTRGQ